MAADISITTLFYNYVKRLSIYVKHVGIEGGMHVYCSGMRAGKGLQSMHVK